MKILVIGQGGREHALAWKISQSSILDALYIAPGNAGTRQHGKNVNISPTDFDAVKEFVIDKKIDVVVVGPEEPLVRGIHDYFIADEILSKVPVIGPTKEAAQLEGSKSFAKAFMGRHNIPTAKYNVFNKDTIENGCSFLESMKPPYVLKADGLAAGKGVLIIDSLAEAKRELIEILSDDKFGSAGTVSYTHLTLPTKA